MTTSHFRAEEFQRIYECLSYKRIVAYLIVGKMREAGINKKWTSTLYK